MEITLDTHTLIWYVVKKLNGRLSKKALETIKKAEADGVIYISVIVLMETLHLAERGRITLSLDKLLEDIEKSSNYRIISFDTKLLQIAATLKGLEAHDRLILATAILTNSYLVSKDKELRDKWKNTVW